MLPSVLPPSATDHVPVLADDVRRLLAVQPDRPERGFSYAVDAPLDMRMDPSADVSAADLVNEGTEKELTQIFRRYGEERYARQIARAVVRTRPLDRTSELVDVIRAAIP